MYGQSISDVNTISPSSGTQLRVNIAGTSSALYYSSTPDGPDLAGFGGGRLVTTGTGLTVPALSWSGANVLGGNNISIPSVGRFDVNSGNNYQYIAYDAANDGVKIVGYKGGSLTNSNGTGDALTWLNNNVAIGSKYDTTYATGGTVTTTVANGVTYKTHAFTTNGTLTVVAGVVITSLVVGGGGGGGNNCGGGGGAGGAVVTTQPIGAGSYSVVVGTGGAGGVSDGQGANGGNSTFNSITGIGGGGGGGAVVNLNGIAGGCGGGGSVGGLGASFTQTGGNKGGDGLPAGGLNVSGGGGGGMGTAGSNATLTNNAGNGGNGATYIIGGTSYLLAGGGGGGTVGGAPYFGVAGAGGTGGGGAGASSVSASGFNATNYGSGGGGSAGGGGGAGGNGYQGVVYISYAIPVVGTITAATLNASGDLSISSSATQTVTISQTDTPTQSSYFQLRTGGDAVMRARSNLILETDGGIYMGPSSVNRYMDGQNIGQPIMQYGTATGSGPTGTVTVTLPAAYNSATSYVVQVTMKDAPPAQLFANPFAADQFLIGWSSAGTGTQNIMWTTFGT
jgi:hypothetical protein